MSWIPTEAVEGLTKLPFSVGVAHFDDPPPDDLDDHRALIEADRCRFVNHLEAWIEADDRGTIVDHGCDGGGLIGSTTMRLGAGFTFGGVAFPDLLAEPEAGPSWVRFTQTCGGHTGVPAPRRVRRPPFVRWSAPSAWTTVQLVLHADGTVEHLLTGASTFPRHWVYDSQRHLVAKSGMIDFDTWYREAHGGATPWGGDEAPVAVAAVESALERQLSLQVMRSGSKPALRVHAAGDVLMRQGEPGDELLLLLDGIVVVEVDGVELAELGPGAMLGERALLEGGVRTSTVTARTRCRFAVADASLVEPASLAQLSQQHRREERGG